jgi:putative tryptophan/tyrosine transport system substrate-binding protein
VPSAARLAIVALSKPGGFVAQRHETESGARTLGILTEIMWVQERNHLTAAFKKISRNRYDGVFVYSNPFTYSDRAEIARLPAVSGVPAVYEAREFVDAGGLLSFGPNVAVSIVARLAMLTGSSKARSPVTFR